MSKTETKVDIETIAHIAKLARLEISQTQAQQYSQQLSQILNYFEQISKVDTQGVEPLITPSEIENFWREDEVKKENNAEEMTANAPARAGNLFKVPPVV